MRGSGAPRHPAGLSGRAFRKPVLHAVAASLVLILLIFAAFEPIRRCSFIAFDDNVYVSSNSMVQKGLTREGFAWAFTTFQAANWHPLTWLSHMLDCEIFGVEAAGHHLMNLALHAAAAVMLFLVQLRMGLSFAPSFLVAAAFGVHPLRVESVAWVSERKDVLAALLWMFTIFAYVAYARRPGAARYLAVLAVLSLGLMAKPMLVTLPFALMLLDFWPLRRVRLFPGEAPGEGPHEIRRGEAFFPAVSLRRGIMEKLPMLVPVAVSAILTILAQHASGAMDVAGKEPLLTRLNVAVVSYGEYLLKLAWPAGLAIMYPHPGAGLAAWKAASSLSALAAVTALVLWKIKSLPGLGVGWFWYLGTLVPVIGFVQVGFQYMADRYTYLPSVGIFIMLFHGGEALLRKGPARRFLFILLPVIILAWAILSRAQVRCWKDSVTLFSRAVEVVPDNYPARIGLGFVYSKQGRLDEAIGQFQEVLRINPEHYFSSASGRKALLILDIHLADALMKKGRAAEALPRLMEARGLDPGNAALGHDLGLACSMLGDTSRAGDFFEEAFRLDPELPGLRGKLAAARHRMGMALAASGQSAPALDSLLRALELTSFPGQKPESTALLREEIGRLFDRRMGELSMKKDVSGMDSTLLRWLAVDPGNARAREWLKRLAPGKGGASRL